MKCNKGEVETIKKTLKKAATYSSNDAIALLLKKDYDSLDGKKLDLFCVSEIKKNANGTIEMKFIDRLKALSLMYEIERDNDNNTENDTITSFMNALKSDD